jgi:serine/threonine protein kinase
MELKVARSRLPELRDYEVLEQIAAGSMATVYRGRQRDSGAPVAIKILLPAVAVNPVLLERFQQEFRAGSTLKHPNIVRTLDCGQVGPTLYLVTEFVEGQDLWQRIENAGRLPEAEAVDLIAQAARGLHELHKHGILHRDVKPDNILITADGRAKLADLGLIKDLEGNLQLTQTRTGLGTPNFIAPEQFTEARQAGVRCDIYALGATLYMAVTGELPFAGRSLATTLKKKLNNDLVPPRQLVPELSRRVEWTIRRAVQADPQRRYASCLEFIQALTGEDTGAAPSSVPEPAAAPRRHPIRERRKGVRYPFTRATVCGMNLSIHEGEAEALGTWEGTVQNLSVAGAGLLLSRRLERGTVVKVTLESPDRRHRRTVELGVARVSRARGRQWFIGGVFAKPLKKEELTKLL